MERNQIMLSFKGAVTAELLTSILGIMENKMTKMEESTKVKKKVFNVLVECLQNLYHHMNEAPMVLETDNEKAAIFMIGRAEDSYTIVTGNYMYKKNKDELKIKMDRVNAADQSELKILYKEVLNNGLMSLKGGGGLGLIDIARKSGQKLDYHFLEIDNEIAFFTLNIKIPLD